ncbi:MAG: MBL fold metallo-hydrolase [Geminicoccaceae bacterium]
MGPHHLNRMHPPFDPPPLRRRHLLASLLLGNLFRAGTSAAQAAAAADLPWHHLPDGTFRNPQGSPTPGGSFGDWTGFMWRRLVAGGPLDTVPDGHVVPEPEVLAGLARGGDTLTWLGHASFLIRLGGRTILTDPFLTEYASPVEGFGPRRWAPAPLRPEQLPPIDLLLLSHNHYDHLDLRALARLPGRERTTVVGPLRLTRYFDPAPFAQVLELDWHQEVPIGPLQVTATPAIHFSKRGLFDRNASLWCGYRVVADGRTVWFAGDTAYGPAFRELGSRYDPPDLALVPIGAYAPRELMRAGHCSPEEAIAIGRDVGAARLVAMHWGTIRMTDEPALEPPELFTAAAAAAGYAAHRAWVMRIGETRAL